MADVNGPRDLLNSQASGPRREMTPQAYRRTVAHLSYGEMHDLVSDIIHSLARIGTDCTMSDRAAIEDVFLGDAYRLRANPLLDDMQVRE